VLTESDVDRNRLWRLQVPDASGQWRSPGTELPLAVAELRRSLAGLADPAAGLRFINTLVQAASEVGNWADDMKDGRFLRALVELGVTVLRVNPTVNLADGTATAEWLEAGLSGDVKGMAQGLSLFAYGIDQIDQSIKALHFSTRLVKSADAIANVGLKAQMKDAASLSHLVNLGGTYAAINPHGYSDDVHLFLDTLWKGQNEPAIAVGAKELQDFLIGVAKPNEVLETGNQSLQLMMRLPGLRDQLQTTELLEVVLIADKYNRTSLIDTSFTYLLADFDTTDLPVFTFVNDSERVRQAIEDFKRTSSGGPNRNNNYWNRVSAS
jgi:hypothetical protein